MHQVARKMSGKLNAYIDTLYQHNCTPRWNVWPPVTHSPPALGGWRRWAHPRWVGDANWPGLSATSFRPDGGRNRPAGASRDRTRWTENPCRRNLLVPESSRQMHSLKNKGRLNAWKYIVWVHETKAVIVPMDQHSVTLIKGMRQCDGCISAICNQDAS